MLFSTWLRNWKRSLERRSALKHTGRRKPSVRRAASRPRLEVLEDRTLPSGLAGVGAIGDSYTVEYQFITGRDAARNWLEQLAEYRGVNFGAFSTSSWDAIRGPGYEYNWATGSASNYDQQVAGLAGQVSAGQVTTAAVMGGTVPELTPGDPSTVFSYLNEVYSGTLTGDALSSVLDANVTQRMNALDTLSAAGSVQLVVADYANFADTPQGQQLFTDPAGRQRLQDADNTLNARLEAAASARGVPVLDIAWLGNYLAQLAANGQPLVIGGFQMDTTDYTPSSQESAGTPINPVDVWGDEQHFGGVAQGLLANMFIDAVDQTYSAGISPFSDQELLANAGLTAPDVGPTYFDVSKYIIYPTPTISSLSTAYAPAGSPSLTLTVTGSHFTSNSVVMGNGGSFSFGSALPTTFINSTTLQATIPSTDLSSPGEDSIWVHDTAGENTNASNVLPFTVYGNVPPLPSIASGYPGNPLSFGLPNDPAGNATSPSGTAITLTGGTANPQPQLTYAWSVTGGPYSVNPNTGTNSANFTFTPEAGGTYVISLTVTDSLGTGSTSAMIDVTPAPPAVNISQNPSVPFQGSLDTTFGKGGTVTTGIAGSDDDEAGRIFSLPNGKVLVAGYTDLGTNDSSLALALFRYNADGTLDSTYQNGAKPGAPPVFGPSNDVAVGPEGQVAIFSGSTLWQFNPDGTADTRSAAAR